MATPITADQLLAQFKKWKVPHRGIGNWKTYGRDDETGKAFGPVYGCITHHTGSDAPDDTNRSLIVNGRSDLPGPLAQFGLNDDGVVDIISIHRANHAGGGDADVLRAVQNESYGAVPPPTHEHEGSSGAVDGNDCFYGVETYYSGSHAPSERAYKSLVLLWAAICDHHGWSSKSVIAHGEWSDWKWDPGNVSMVKLRADIDAALKGKDDDPKPNLKTPKITAAIKANIAYDKALDEIERQGLADEVKAWRHQVREQRLALKELEK
jgi:hypothetical protein